MPGDKYKFVAIRERWLLSHPHMSKMIVAPTHPTYTRKLKDLIVELARTDLGYSPSTFAGDIYGALYRHKKKLIEQGKMTDGQDTEHSSPVKPEMGDAKKA
jgi:hypothetical protein